MSDSKESKCKSWHIDYEKQIKYYESQQAALIALDLIISSYESGIWSGNSHLYLWHQEGEAVNRDLLDRHYSANVLIATSYEQMFRIELFVKNKEDWIFKYGSDLLQQSILAGYECNDGYLAERVARDYPGFKVNDRKYEKVDTPNEWCLDACLGYENAHCAFDYDYYHKHTSYYIAIDNFLGKYQLIKPIDDLARIAKENSIKIATLNALEAENKRSIILLLVATGGGCIFILVGLFPLFVHFFPLGLQP
jgi:hypothetical protein